MKRFNFVKFEGLNTRGDTKIAINKSGLIRLSAGFCRATNITIYKFATLFYDKNNSAIAIKFRVLPEKGSFKVTKDKGAATLHVTSFMKANNLLLRSNFRRYDWKRENIIGIGEVYIIELGKK